MKKIILMCLFGLMFSDSEDSSDDNPIHPILKRLEDCHSDEANWYTRGMVRCEINAKDEWEKEMDKYYKLLLEALDDGYSDDSRNKLIESQEAWIKYYEKENSYLLNEYYTNRDRGTLGKLMYAQKVSKIMQSRALQLEEYKKETYRRSD